MKHQFKIVFLIALGLFNLGVTNAAETTTVGLREEASTLENIYQEKARNTLDTLLNQEEFE